MTNLLDADRADLLLERIRSVQVLVVGDLMLDVYLRGDATRISPEAPVPVVRVVEEWRALGGAANVAANLAALGASAPLVGVVGRDAAGEEFMDVAAREGLDQSGVIRVEGRPTSVKTRVLVGHQQVARYDRETETDLDSTAAQSLIETVDRLASDAGAIVVADYDKGVLVQAVIDAALDAARRYDLPLVVDPKARRFSGYGGCTVFKPNLSELASALRAPIEAGSPEWMERTRRHLECDHLLLTLGAGGMALMTSAGRHLEVPAVARSVYDVSGAGDTVAAVVAASMAAGGTIEESAVLATHAAGIEVGKAGVATVSAAEIMASLRQTDSGAPVV